MCGDWKMFENCERVTDPPVTVQKREFFLQHRLLIYYPLQYDNIIYYKHYSFILQYSILFILSTYDNV